MSAPLNVVGLFCEDVREEKTGHTVIGILPDNMNVSALPGALPRLGIYIRCHVDPSAEIGAISGKLRFADGEEIHLATFDETAVKKTQAETRDKGTPLAGFIMVAVAMMVQIKVAGSISAFVNIGGAEILAASLNIQVDHPTSPAATATPARVR
jgi:hypothetical protein